MLMNQSQAAYYWTLIINANNIQVPLKFIQNELVSKKQTAS